MMKIAIVGAGAIGGLAGAYMVKGGEDVLFVDKNPEHVEGMNARGLRIVGLKGTMTVPARAVLPEAIDEPLEAVFVATKSQHTTDAVRAVAPHLLPQGFVVSLQNGMNEEKIAQIIGKERVIGAIPDYTAAYLDPGIIEFTAEGPIYVGELNGETTQRIREVQRVCSHLTHTEVLPDIWGRLWAKHIYGSQIVLSALVDAPIWEVFEPEWTRRLAGSVVREALSVADAAEISLPSGPFFEPSLYRPKTPEDTRRLLAHIERTMEKLGKHRAEREEQAGGYRFVKVASGIWWDLVYRQRKSEVEGLTGDLVQRAERLGVPVPLNQRLAHLIYEVEDHRRTLGWDNLREMERLVNEVGANLP